MTTYPSGRRVALRLSVCLALLCALEFAVRRHERILDGVFLHHYRMPDVQVPPIEVFAEAIARRRDEAPSSWLVGLAGPSFVYGVGVPETQTMSARVESRLRATGIDVRILNISLPGNRFDDDRLVAQHFAGTLDLVLVPYSAGSAVWVMDSCPQHLAVLEWTDESGKPFTLPPGCDDAPRHLTNVWLENHVLRHWQTYYRRAALRKLLFPADGDFGRMLFTSVNARFAKPHGHPRPVDGHPPTLLQLPAGQAPAVPPEMTAQVARLCQAYNARGTKVLFYAFPQFERPGQPARELELFHGLHQAIRDEASKGASCGVLPLGETHLLPEDYVDHGHPNAQGADKIASALSRALSALRASAGEGGPRP